MTKYYGKMNRINISEEQKDTCICLLLRINDYLEIIQPVANNYIRLITRKLIPKQKQ